MIAKRVEGKIFYKAILKLADLTIFAVSYIGGEAGWVGFSKWQLIRPDGIINDLSGDVESFFRYYNVIILFYGTALWNC
ncbi:hypothetical protein [Bartonella grahamii]|uniref:hypothetical protein n=1 Tax=Bartonella grahamii TaxID=33045 RepID=UPI002E7B8F6A|nr:hypothetical protein [Bartonella grahamii]